MQDRFKFRTYHIPIKTMEYNGQWSGKDYDKKFNDCNFIVMQCTGLKDKYDKLIYEGDILGGIFEGCFVHWCDSCKHFELAVKYRGQTECMACEGDIRWYEVVESEEQNELEVIGNIYQDKELLEVK